MTGPGASPPFRSTAVPDPTSLTTEQLLREIAGLKAYMEGQLAIRDERLNGIDRATELRWPVVEGFPGLVEEKVGHASELSSEKFNSIRNQFNLVERQRVEQKKDTKDAVDAALAAAKEAVKEQTAASERSINKSELATSEQLKQLTTTFRTAGSGQSDKIEDLKERVARIETTAITIVQTGQDAGQQKRDSSALVLGVVGTLIGISGIVSAIVIAATK